MPTKRNIIRFSIIINHNGIFFPHVKYKNNADTIKTTIAAPIIINIAFLSHELYTEVSAEGIEYICLRLSIGKFLITFFKLPSLSFCANACGRYFCILSFISFLKAFDSS